MDKNNQITIEFTPEQQFDIAQKCGFSPVPIVISALGLTMLSLAASAVKSDFLPLVRLISTAKIVLEQKQNSSSFSSLYVVWLKLTSEQREIIKRITNKDWNQVAILPDEHSISFPESWNSHSSINRIGKSIVIISQDAVYSPSTNDILIKLPFDENITKNSFGTGKHSTTQIALILLEKYFGDAATVLDVGTGSGILAIAAAQLGAKRVVAIDIDADSVLAAQEIVRLNKVENLVEVKQIEIGLINEKFEFIVANLFPSIIISLAKELADKIADNGILIVSGIIEPRMNEIIQVLEKSGFNRLEVLIIESWCGMAFKRT